MSAKRALGDDSETPLAKRQLSALEIAIEVEEEMKSNKRKVGSLGVVSDDSTPKSPKKSIEKPGSSTSRAEPIEIIEILSDNDNSIVTDETAARSISATQHIPRVSLSAGRNTELVSQTKLPEVRQNRTADDAIKPNGVQLPTERVQHTAPTSQRTASVPAVVMSNDIEQHGDEIHKLWSQYAVALDTCVSTVSPLFVTMILTLYLSSVVTRSQTVASIGLVYVFVFFILLFSYFAAIVPFILISNTLCSVLISQGQKPEKDYVRLGVLFSVIVATGAYCRYGHAVL